MDDTTATTEVQDNTEVEAAQESTNQSEEKADAPKYTDADVDKIIDKKFAKFKAELEQKDKEKEEAVAEAEKLAKMNAAEKQQYEAKRQQHEFEKMQNELESLRKQQTHYSLSKEASTMLSEQGIAATDGILSVVVRDTAEDTKTAVNAFVEAVNKTVEAKVKEKLKGEAPKVASKSEPLDVFALKLKKYE